MKIKKYKIRKGIVLIDVFDIIGKEVQGYTIQSYLGKTYSHTKGGDRARHWYKCRCNKCGNIVPRKYRRDQITSGRLPKRCPVCSTLDKDKKGDIYDKCRV